MSDLPDWAAEERAHKNRLDDETWEDDDQDDDEYMTREEMDLP